MTTRAADDSRLSGQTTVAVLLVILAMMVGTAIDVLVRQLAGSMAIGQVMALRSLIAGLILLPAFLRGGRRLVVGVRPLLQLFRAVMSTATTFLMFYAVAHMPLAEANAYFFAQALFTVPIAWVALGERPGHGRLFATVLGFAGVLIALSTSSGREETELLGIAAALGCAFTAAVTTVLLRRLAADERPVTLLGWQMATGLIVFGPGAVVQWSPMDAVVLALAAAVAVLVLAVNWLLIQAFRRAEATALSPAFYSALPFGVIAGWLAFGEVPRPEVWAGSALIALGVWMTTRVR